MSDTPEQIVAARLRQILTGKSVEIADSYAADLIGVLEDDGWSLVRLDDCESIRLVPDSLADGVVVMEQDGPFGFYEAPDSDVLKPGTYALVPVSSGETGGET